MTPPLRAPIVILSLTLPLLLLSGTPSVPAPLTPEPVAPTAPSPHARPASPAPFAVAAAKPVSTAAVVISETKNKDSVPTAPPGLVSLKGGRTRIGSTTKEIQGLLDDDASLMTSVSPLDAETPQYSTTVGPFHLMLTEVTNEQYREFVKATGHQPPQTWGEAAIAEGRAAYFEIEANRGSKFYAKSFWNDNWEGKTWEINDKDLLSPVVYIDYSDALSYCEWAGLRLPTEEEFQHACRLKSSDPYPWGTDGTPTKYAITREFRGVKGPMPVAILADSKSPSGLYDLIGNAWEWTSSPYVEFKGWKQHTYNTGTSKKNRRKKKSDPVWNGDRRVSVGGSYQLPLLASRCTIRRGTERTQKTAAVGFRAASSENPKSDKASSIYRSKVRLSPARADGVTFNTDLAFGWIHWESRESELSKSQTKTLLKSIRRIKPVQTQYTVPADYRVITDYRYILFTPTKVIEANSDKALERGSLHTPVQLGFLSFGADLVSPALPAGTYMVSYRAKGDHPGPSSEEKKAAKDEGSEFEIPAYLSTINVETPNILFFDAVTGELAAHVPVNKNPSITGGAAGGELESYVEKLRVKGPDGKPAFDIKTWLKFSMRLAGKASRRVTVYEFNVQPAAGFVDQSWIR